MKKQTTKNIGFVIIALVASLFMLNSCDDDDAGLSSEQFEDILVKIEAEKGFAIMGESLDFKLTPDSLASSISSYAWTFEGGSPESSTEPAPTVTYNSEGTFQASLTVVRSSDNKEFNGVFDVLVLEKASTAFMADTRSIEQGQQVTFRSMSSSNDNLVWTFEGGTPETSTEPEVVVTYPNGGTFDVSLASALNGSQTTSTETDYIEVVGLAAPTFTATATTINQNESITYTNTTPITDATVKWIFTGGDIPTSTDNEVTVTYAEPGVFDVTLEIVKNGITNTLVETGYTTVNVAPAQLVSAESNFGGSQIILDYDLPLNDPSSETITVSVDGANSPVSSVALNLADNTKIAVILANPIASTAAAITVTYSSPVTTTIDGGALPALTNQAVVNNFFDTSTATNLFATGDFEGVTTNQYDVNNGFLGGGNAGAIAASFPDGQGVGGSRALSYTVTGGVVGDARTIFGDKDGANVQLITPVADGVTYLVKAKIKYTGVKPSQFEFGIINFPFRNNTRVTANMDLTALTAGADFIEVEGTLTTINGIDATAYAIPKLTAGDGDSVFIVDDIEVFTLQ